jgi:pimeloyl-ACP methyl ester carboxylesterase
MGARVALEVLRSATDRVTRVALLDTGYLARAAGAAGEEEARKRQALLDVARRDGVRAMACQWVQGMVHPDRLQDAPLLDAIVGMFERKSPDVFERQIRALLQRPDATGVLRAIRVPTLVLCGRQDSWAPVPQHEAMHALIPGAVFEVIEDAGHMAPMERPQAVAGALLRWLETP